MEEKNKGKSGNVTPKHLFDEHFKYTSTSSDLDRKIHAKLSKIFKDYIKQGYSPREISHIIIHCAIDQECCAVLDHGMKRYKKSKKEKES